MIIINLNREIKKSIKYIISENYYSYDLFDALTCKWIDKYSKNYDLLRRIFIQIFARSPIDFHWIGMKKIVHTKLISDMLWLKSLRYKNHIENNPEELLKLYTKLLEQRSNKDVYLWGLNFPYTSRFINADEFTPNIYNTSTCGLALAEFYECNLIPKHEVENIFTDMFNNIEEKFKFVDEGDKGWYSYYPGQIKPTYNVNALTAYFYSKVNWVSGRNIIDPLKIKKLIGLIIKEQNKEGSWYYGRSEKGRWVDGFHSGFIIESLAYIYTHGYKSNELEKCLNSGISYYLNKLMIADGYPKYMNNSTKYPIEAQNYAQAIQTLALCGLWLKKDYRKLLENIIDNLFKNLYCEKGYFYHKKNKYFSYKTSFLRWSTSPNLVALQYAEEYLNPSI